MVIKGSKKTSKIIYIFVIVVSISICFLGIKTNAGEEHQRKIEYAKATIKNEEIKMNRLNKQIFQLYQNGQEEFLVEPIDDEKVRGIESDILTLKTEAIDFGLKDKDFSIDTSEMTEGKKELLAKIADIKNKKDLQKQVTALIIDTPTDWSADTIDVVINENASVQLVSQIQHEVSKSENDWNKAIISYLKEIESQIKQYTDLKQSITAMNQNGELTDQATVENFILIFNQLDLIKSEPLKKELSDELDVIDKLLENQATSEVVPDQESITPSE